MNYSSIPGPGDSATWSRMPAGYDGERDISADRDLWLTMPSNTLEWICEASKAQYDQAVDVVHTDDMSTLTVDQLWSMLLAGNNQQCLRARHELVQRMTKNNPQIERLANAYVEPVDYSNDPHLWF